MGKTVGAVHTVGQKPQLILPVTVVVGGGEVGVKVAGALFLRTAVNGVDLPVLAVGALCNVNGRELPLFEPGGNSPHVSGEIVTDSGKTLQKVVDTEDGSPFEISVALCIGSGGIVSDDDDIFAHGADEKSVTVKEFRFHAVLFSKGFVPHDDGRVFPGRTGENRKFHSQDP